MKRTKPQRGVELGLTPASATEVASWLRNAKPCVVLTGAGCSYSANVLLASEVVEYVRLEHSDAYLRAAKRSRPDAPGYPEVMKELRGQARTKTFLQIVEHSTLNRAHAALGYLVRAEYVGRVLTTNFDDLVVRGCAFQGIFPPVYDLGMLGALGAEDEHAGYFRRTLGVIEPVIFYLHGRHNGAYQIHSAPQAEAQRARLAPIVESARERLWIIAGYSGASDPLWQTLRTLLRGPQPARICWVNLAPPSGPVARDLSKAGASFVRSDADSFFTALANALAPRKRLIVRSSAPRGVDAAPRWLAHPLATVHDMAQRLGGATSPEQGPDLVALEERIERAVASLDHQPPRTAQAWRRLRDVLDDLDPAQSHRSLAGVVGQRRSLHIGRDKRRDYDRLVTLLRARNSGPARGLRERALCAAARAVEAHASHERELLEGATELQRQLGETARRTASAPLHLALAGVLLARAHHRAVEDGTEATGLLNSAAAALDCAFAANGAGKATTALRKGLRRVRKLAEVPQRREGLRALLEQARAAQDGSKHSR